MPGTSLGRLNIEVASQTGLLPETRVVAPASHDTALAVVGVLALVKAGCSGTSIGHMSRGACGRRSGLNSTRRFSQRKPNGPVSPTSAA